MSEFQMDGSRITKGMKGEMLGDGAMYPEFMLVAPTQYAIGALVGESAFVPTNIIT